MLRNKKRFINLWQLEELRLLMKSDCLFDQCLYNCYWRDLVVRLQFPLAQIHLYKTVDMDKYNLRNYFFFTTHILKFLIFWVLFSSLEIIDVFCFLSCLKTPLPTKMSGILLLSQWSLKFCQKIFKQTLGQNVSHHVTFCFTGKAVDTLHPES